MSFPLIFERSRQGRTGYSIPTLDVPAVNPSDVLPDAVRREHEPWLPEVSEVDVVRHYTNLSRRNHAIDVGFYPLGSCTMKYNPKVNEDVAVLPGFTGVHPLQPQHTAQGTLELMYRLLDALCEVTGMQWGTLQPFAGAHGEFVGMKLFKAYFRSKGDTGRTKVLVPDSAHGTNPASAHIAGFEVVQIQSSDRGMITADSIREHVDESLAGIMLTNPNTLGLFEQEIQEIAQMVHEAGGLLYYDGANLNAIMGKVRPGDMGFDVVHLNLHKTFSTPHGGGGPGAGPVLVNDTLIPHLPNPDVVHENGVYRLEDRFQKSIGRMAGFYGNVGVLVRAFAYILAMGRDGLTEAAERAVLNANYLKKQLSRLYHVPFDSVCKHEFVLSGDPIKEQYGVSTLNIAKRMLDYGVHPPTIYFPLIVHEAMMMEPTETESKEVLDEFVEIMSKIYREIQTDPELLTTAPHETPVKRVNEVLAAKKPVVRWQPDENP
jgi:glycine dehydrogenase subunit 2